MEAQPPSDAVVVDPARSEKRQSGAKPGGRTAKRMRREQRRAEAAAAEQAAAVPAEAPSAEAEIVPQPHVTIELGSAVGDGASEHQQERPLAPPLSARVLAGVTPRTDASARSDTDGEASFENAASSWPPVARGIAIAAMQTAVWLAQLWAIAAGLALVVPMALLHFALPSLFSRPLAFARAVAQRPLLVLSVAVAAPLYLRECSWGIDFDAMPGFSRPATMPDLARAVRCLCRSCAHLRVSHPRSAQLKGGSIKRWNNKVRQARNAMEAAGISARFVPSARFSPGIAHRRVLLAHMRSHNDGALARITWLAAGVCALHSMHGDCVEFRDVTTNALQAFSLVVTQGGYSAGVLYACRPEVARAGIWITNAVTIMEQMVAEDGTLGRVRFFDVGPTFGVLKGHVGMHPLPWRRTVAMAAFSRALQ